MSDLKIDYEAASKEIQDIVKGACLDPKIQAKARAANHPSNLPDLLVDSKLGGHWAGRVVAAALPDGDLYVQCRECEGSGWTGEDMCDLCVTSDAPLGWDKVER